MNYSLLRKIFFLSIFLFFSSALSSQTIYVKQGASGTGSSWANARGDLRGAIGSASSGTQIWVAEGTYYPTSGTNRSRYFYLKNGVEIYGGFPNTGNPTMSDRDYTAHPTIMSGDIGVVGTNTDNSYHILYNSGSINTTAVLDGFILEKAYGSSGSGAGMYLRNASPTIRNCVIRNNYTANYGGAMYMRDNCSNAVFTNCTFSNNHSHRRGGGFYLTNANCNPTFNNCTIDTNKSDDYGSGIYINSCSPVFNNCSISDNTITVVNRSGGGFYISGSSNPTIQNCTISNNTATNMGGGIYDVSNAHTTAISGNTISGNTINGGYARGGGIYLDNSKPNISGNTIKNNTAATTADNNSRGYGGGIYVNGSDLDVLISNNTIENNTATSSGNGNSCGRGGGIYLNQSPANLQNNIIKNNTANTTGTGSYCGEGGGIYMYRTLSDLLSSNTISSNKSIRYGAGIYMYQSNPTLTNNTIDGNIINSGYDNEGKGAGIFIYDDTGGGASPILNGNTISNNQANANGHANAGYGGGVFIRSGVKPVFTANIIDNNSASQRGGGVYIRDNNSNAVFNRNEIKNNSSADGGGIYIDGNKTCKFYNNLMYSNSATNGGAVYFSANDAGIFLNNTVADNTATNGGAIYFNNNSDLYLKNIIFWGNTASTSGNTIYINDGGSDPYFQYCDVQGGSASFAGAGSGASYNSGHYSNNINTDPLFSDAVYHITLGSSPCIGAGDPATVVGDFPSDEDYDGNKRIRGVIDVGAYETNNAPEFITSGGADDPGPENVTMDEDANPTAFSLTLYAKDIDDDNLSWSIISAASHGTASVPASTTTPNPQSVAVSYSPNANYNGTDMFKVQISDGAKTDIIEVDVTINSVNDTPTFVTNPSVLSVKAGQTWTYNVSTSDVDDALNTLTLTCPTKPAGMSFSAGSNGTATLTWTPTDAQVSPPNYTVTLRVTDPHGAFSEQTFNLTVKTRFIYVPADYPTIQQAIDAAVDGQDKIVISDGTYTENINTKGKTIEIQGNSTDPSKVIINGNNTGPCIVVDQGGSPSISDISLTNGSGQVGLPSIHTVHAPASGYYGGAIVVYKSNPTFTDMIISANSLSTNNNHGGSGAGIYIGNNSDVTIKGNSIIFQIKNNKSKVYRGGGICIDDSKLDIQNAEISDNYAGDYGGGIAAYNSTIDMKNVKINNNKVDGRNGSGGGIFLLNSTLNDNGGNSHTGNSSSRFGNYKYIYQ